MKIKITLGQLRKYIHESLHQDSFPPGRWMANSGEPADEEDLERLSEENDAKTVESSYEENLDNVMNGLKLSLDGLEDAHPQAPDEESKAIVAGLHSDLFNAKAQARPFLMKLKSKLKASKGSIK